MNREEIKGMAKKEKWRKGREGNEMGMGEKGREERSEKRRKGVGNEARARG